VKRAVEPELLDELAADDPRAMWSRRDLQRVNVLMGNARIAARALRGGGVFAEGAPRSIVDLGAGDGTPLLRLARKIGPRWKSVRAVLVDRRRLLSAETEAEFARLGWRVECVDMDVFEWLGRARAEKSDLTIASLFLHHFKEEDLRKLLTLAAHQTEMFLACEPRRANLAFCAASLLGFVGCNGVTRHDAKVSVRAGFAARELSALWPAGEEWRLAERPAGLFSHCFVARRIGENGNAS
jgi:hypothetical protein